jgi:hypothetical protein
MEILNMETFWKLALLHDDWVTVTICINSVFCLYIIIRDFLHFLIVQIFFLNNEKYPIKKPIF